MSEFSPDLLQIYYARIFPYNELFNWLSYGNQEPRFFQRREFSFTIEDDIYIRYQCFMSEDEMKASIQKKQPHKIDIGAVFNELPKEHVSLGPNLKTEERELVFDIDMTDYDDIRTCCTGANICGRCWPFMTMSLKVLDRSLREDFGFQHILWIYSGRRGIHCWVSDTHARTLSNPARSAVVDYLTVEAGTDTNDKKTRFTFQKPFHPMIQRAYEMLSPDFDRYLVDEEGQNIFDGISGLKILSTLPNNSLKNELMESWKRFSSMSSRERWQSIVEKITPPPSLSASFASSSSSSSTITNSKKRSSSSSSSSSSSTTTTFTQQQYDELEKWKYQLIFKYCYPRLDANVSKAQNHLLKSPFCVHPKTGRVCIPMDPRVADEFDPTSVPTIRQLCSEIDSFDREHPDLADSTLDINKTSMKDCMSIFHETFMNGLMTSLRRERRERLQREAAMTGDF